MSGMHVALFFLAGRCAGIIAFVIVAIALHQAGFSVPITKRGKTM
jgi:hypothetical protein